MINIEALQHVILDKYIYFPFLDEQKQMAHNSPMR